LALALQSHFEVFAAILVVVVSLDDVLSFLYLPFLHGGWFWPKWCLRELIVVIFVLTLIQISIK